MKRTILLLVLLPCLLLAQESGFVRPDGRRVLGHAGHFRPNTVGTIQLKRGGAIRYFTSIDLLNGFALAAGDSVFFAKGQIYRGQINASVDSVYYGSYGTGAKPIISGSELLTGWVERGSYYATKASQDVGDLWIDGVQQTVARFPNTGFATVDNAGSTFIKSDELTQEDDYWNGGVVRFKPNSYTWEFSTVSDFVADGDTLKFATGSYGPQANYGFYIEGPLAALDTADEWATVSATDSVYVYANPTSSTAEASVKDYGIYITASNVTVSGLDFRYQLKAAVRIAGTVEGINVASCDISNQRWDGIYSSDTTTASVIDSCTFRDVRGNAVEFTKGSTDTIRHSTFDVIGTVEGYGMRANGYMVISSGIQFGPTTSSNVVSQNVLDSVGYQGVLIKGHSHLVEKNILTNIVMCYADGGALASYSEDPSTAYGTLWQYNIVDGVQGSALACPSGRDIYVMGLYWDHGSQHMKAQYNTFANIKTSGVWQSIGSHHDTLYHNNIHNVCQGGILATGGIHLDIEDTTSENGNCYIGNRVFVDSVTAVSPLYVKADYVEAEFPKADLGTIDSNYYYEETSSAVTKLFHDGTWQSTAYTLAAWRTFSSQDAGSAGRFSQYRPKYDSVVIYQNRSDTSLTQSFSGGTHRTLTGDSVTSVTLSPYSSAMYMWVDTTVVMDTIDATTRDGNSIETNDERLVSGDGSSNHTGLHAAVGVCWAGFQFKLPIPQGAIIDSAIITHRYQGVTTGTWGTDDSLRWCAYDTSNCPVFADDHAHELPGHAPLTTAVVNFSPVLPASGYFDSPNLAPLLQEVVNRPDFVPGGYVGFIVGPHATLTTPHTFNLGDYGSDGTIAARIRVFFH